MKVYVNGTKLSIPRKCVCCGGEPDHHVTTAASNTSGKRSKSWDFHSCTACARHRSKWNNSTTLLSVSVLVGLIAACILRNTPVEALLVAFIIIAPGVALGINGRANAKALCLSMCPSPTATARYLGWNGTLHSFFFDSQTYALEFMQANRAKLVNVSYEAMELLNKASPTPRIYEPLPTVSSQPTINLRSAPTSGTTLDQLERLAALKAQGILSEDEFNEQKRQILGSST